MVAAVKGYKLVLVMPDSMSIERRRLMLAYGATFVLTPRAEGMKGAIAKAQELVDTTPGSWMPQQFDNPGQHRRARAHDRARDPRRLPGGSRRADHRRGHRRAYHRLRARAEEGVAQLSRCSPSSRL